MFKENILDIFLEPETIFEKCGRMLRAPTLNPRTYIFSVLQCNCQTYDDIFRQIFQNPRFATLGAYNMFEKYARQS